MACQAEARKRIVMPAFALRYGAAAFARHCVAGEGWWEVLVMLQSSLPTVVCDTGFTDRQPEHLPEENPKSECRNPNLNSHCADSSGFGLRNFFGLRGFGLRI